MGADLICEYLEIAKDKQPDFAAAMKLVKSLSNEDVVAAFLEAEDTDDAPDSDDELDKFAAECRLKINDAVVYIEKCWNTYLRTTDKLDLHSSVLLIAAGTSWGDPIEGQEEFALFRACGAAEAAGFYVC